MITITAEMCTGCAACVEVCPTGALFLVEGKAAVDRELCSECEACLAACPTGAIALVGHEEPAQERALLPTRESQVEPQALGIRSRTLPALKRSEGLPARVLPFVGAALTWASREILPRLADLALDRLDRRASGSQAPVRGPSTESQSRRTEGKGRQHRRRRRGGES